ncbi:hypothetical protein ULG90_01865 [Halopseudomonas pachastrellae]|nr:hypothetical protein ULG90_01865 [Halopseudomonas pachastrellae]
MANSTPNTRFRLGLIINPLAGLGGRAALKGSDGVADDALAMGVEPQAHNRVRQTLEHLLPLCERLQILSAPGPWAPICWPTWGLMHRWSVSWPTRRTPRRRHRNHRPADAPAGR